MIRTNQENANVPEEPPPRSERVRAYLRNRILPLLVLCFLASAPIPLARFFWVFELFTHFRIQFFAAFFFLLTLSLYIRAWREALVATIFVCFHGSALAPWYIAPPKVDANGPTIQLMSANVLTSNTHYDDFLAIVKENDPDMLLVQEINDAWLTALDPLRSDYPYVTAEARSDNFGIATFSRIELTKSEIMFDPESLVPSIQSIVELDGHSVTVINYHTLPPAGPRYAKTRNRQLAFLKDKVVSTDNHVIIAGDLNTTMWSPHYLDLVREGKLKNARKGFGLQPTWMRDRIPFLTLPLDHVLCSAHLHATASKVLPSFGSDHRAILVNLALQVE